MKVVKKRKLISKSTLPSDDPSSTSAADEDPSPPSSAVDPPPAAAVDADEPPPAAADVPQPEAEPTSMAEDPIAPEGSQSPPPEANGTAEPPLEPNSKPEPDIEPEPTRDLLEPLAKDQLVELLLRASSRHPDVLDEIRDVAGSDPVNRKIFVHGFSWDTSTENLLSFFSQFGEVEDCYAVQNKATGKSKGYGFVLFKHRSGARKALKEPQKMIGNRMASCQLASLGHIPASLPASLPASEYTQRKIYVSNVSADIDPHKLTQFFAKFGEIEEGPLGLDKQTGKPKGFCLFVYKAVEGARKALEEPYRNFEGHLLHCQKAIDGPKVSSNLHAKSTVGYGSGVLSQMTPLGTGHLMAPSQPTVGYNPIAQQASAAINPTFEQALTALLTTPNAGIGLTNILGSLGSSAQVPGQALLPHGGYVNQAAGLGGGYSGQPYGVGRGLQGGYHGGGPRPPYLGR